MITFSDLSDSALRAVVSGPENAVTLERVLARTIPLRERILLLKAAVGRLQPQPAYRLAALGALAAPTPAFTRIDIGRAESEGAIAAFDRVMSVVGLCVLQYGCSACLVKFMERVNLPLRWGSIAPWDWGERLDRGRRIFGTM